jgi:hypothetical protein
MFKYNANTLKSEPFRNSNITSVCFGFMGVYFICGEYKLTEFKTFEMNFRDEKMIANHHLS